MLQVTPFRICSSFAVPNTRLGRFADANWLGPFSAKCKITIILGLNAIAIRANAIRERAAKRAPAGERERLVAANGIAVCLATFAMAF